MIKWNGKKRRLIDFSSEGYEALRIAAQALEVQYGPEDNLDDEKWRPRPTRTKGWITKTSRGDWIEIYLDGLKTKRGLILRGLYMSDEEIGWKLHGSLEICFIDKPDSVEYSAYLLRDDRIMVMNEKSKKTHIGTSHLDREEIGGEELLEIAFKEVLSL